VALWNAARYHGIEVPEIGGEQYRTIVAESRCLHGGCVFIEVERRRLNLFFIPGRISFSWISAHLPVHFAVHCHQGFHSVLGVEIRDENIKLANYAKGRLQSMSWELLKKKIDKRVKPYSIAMCEKHEEKGGRKMVEPKEQVGYCAQVLRAGGTDTRLGGSEMFRHIYHKKRWRSLRR